MKCLLEAHDSNRARFDRECLAHLTNRMKMWEVAARVRTDETSAEYALTKLRGQAAWLILHCFLDLLKNFIL